MVCREYENPDRIEHAQYKVLGVRPSMQQPMLYVFFRRAESAGHFARGSKRKFTRVRLAPATGLRYADERCSDILTRAESFLENTYTDEKVGRRLILTNSLRDPPDFGVRGRSMANVIGQLAIRSSYSAAPNPGLALHF
jgi:hypothetical protein